MFMKRISYCILQHDLRCCNASTQFYSSSITTMQQHQYYSVLNNQIKLINRHLPYEQASFLSSLSAITAQSSSLITEHSCKDRRELEQKTQSIWVTVLTGSECCICETAEFLVCRIADHLVQNFGKKKIHPQAGLFIDLIVV